MNNLLSSTNKFIVKAPNYSLETGSLIQKSIITPIPYSVALKTVGSRNQNPPNIKHSKLDLLQFAEQKQLCFILAFITINVSKSSARNQQSVKKFFRFIAPKCTSACYHKNKIKK